MSTTTPESADERLGRLPSVLQTVGLGRTAWLDLVKAGKAPQPVKIGRATLWRMSEIQSWIAERVRMSRELRK
jgi:predicted DNA-binding transcriptional regulator AlpA